MNLQRVVPLRRYRFGPKPGIKSQEAQEPDNRNEDSSLWVFRSKDPTEEEKRRMIGALLEISIAASFNLHLYSFGGECYLQLGGGPIGSRLTMAVSKIVMLVWGRQVKEAIRRAGLRLYVEGLMLMI